MEYIPYVIATGFFSSSLSYFVRYRSEDIEEPGEMENNCEFEIVNDEGACKMYLGDTFKEKSEKMTKICQNECNLKMKIYSKKKHYNKLKKYIYEYEKVGHEEFVKSHYQAPNS